MRSSHAALQVQPALLSALRAILMERMAAHELIHAATAELLAQLRARTNKYGSN